MFWCRVEVSCRGDWWKEWALASYLHRAHKKDSFLLSSSFFSWLILSLYRRILTANNTNPDILFATEFMLIQMTASVAILFLFVPKASIIVIHCKRRCLTIPGKRIAVQLDWFCCLLPLIWIACSNRTVNEARRENKRHDSSRGVKKRERLEFGSVWTIGTKSPSIFALPFQSVLRAEQASIRNVRNILCCFS